MSIRAYKMQSAVDLWEDNKKASIEAKFKGIEVKCVQFLHQFDWFFLLSIIII